MPYEFTSTTRATVWEPGKLFLGIDVNNVPVGIETERNAITIAGAGSGKGAAVLIQNARRWPQNLLVIDPKGENAAACWEARQALGQKVIVLDPYKSAKVPVEVRGSFNPLAAIDLNSPNARDDIKVIAEGLIVVHDPKHMDWVATARIILSGIIAFVLADAPPELRTFKTVRKILMQRDASEDGQGGLYGDALAMTGIDAFGGLCISGGNTLLAAMASTKGMEKDALHNVKVATDWLDTPEIQSVLGNSSFQLQEIKTGKASIFLVLPPKFLRAQSAFLALFVRCAIHEMMNDGPDHGSRCLFLLDEFYALGKIDEIAVSAGLMRGYGLHLWPFLQDLGQLIELYGHQGAHFFFSCADVHMFFGNTDAPTLSYISDRLGIITQNEVAPDAPYAISGNANNPVDQARAANWNENARMQYQHAMANVGRPRFSPDQIRGMVAKYDGDKVARKMIVFGKGNDVFNPWLMPYFIRQPDIIYYTPFWQREETRAFFGLIALALRLVLGVIIGWNLAQYLQELLDIENLYARAILTGVTTGGTLWALYFIIPIKPIKPPEQPSMGKGKGSD